MHNGSLFDSDDEPQGGLSGEIQPYEFPFTGQEVRVVLINGDPWFVANDVCAILGYAHTGSTLRMLRDREKGEHPMHTPGGVQDLKVISEPGLYRLIMRSNRPFAEKFQDWVVEVVLPSIRKTGKYAPVEAAPSHPESLRKWAAEIEAREAAERRAEIEAAGRQAAEEEIKILEPKAAQADHHRAADGLMTVGDFANKLKAWAKDECGVKVLHKEVWDFCRELNLLMKSTNTVRKNRVTSFAIEQGYLREKDSEHTDEDGNVFTNHTPRITPKGEGWIWDRATRRISETNTLRPANAKAA